MPNGTSRHPASWRHRHAKPALPSGVPAYLVPNSITEVRELAALIAAGEWAPSSYRGVDGKYVLDKIVLGVMHGAAVGLGPFAAIHAIAVIDGHPTIWGDGALALVERSGLIEDMCEDYVVDDDEGLTAICTMCRRSWPTPISRRFSMAMAEGAGLTQKEGPWQTYPRRMLMMRARSWALRDGFADVLRGLALREEVEDYEELGTPPTVAPRHPTGRSQAPCRSGAARPRLADYIAASDPDQRTRPHIRTSDTDSELCPVGANGGTRPVTADGLPELTKHPLTGVANDAADAIVAGKVPEGLHEPDGAAASIPPSGGGSSDLGIEGTSSFSLIDAEGNFIEASELDDLRDAFERLFADPCLTADQIVGLWESNAVARRQLTDAFGADVLDDARHRQASAVGHRNPHAAACLPVSRRKPSRSKKLRLVSPASASETDLSLKIDTAWSDEKLLHHYQSRLLALRLNRAKTEAFVDFRLANKTVENRLRTRLPQLMGAIDEVYAWASTQSR